MSRHLNVRLTAVPLIICAFVFVGHGQTPQSPYTYGEPDGLTGADCEGVMMRLDFIAAAAGEAGQDQSIIIIARPGGGETTRTSGGRRLRQVAHYLHRRIPKERVITAEGERVRGLGKIEFYAGGKLHTILIVKRNRDLVAGCGAS